MRGSFVLLFFGAAIGFLGCNSSQDKVIVRAENVDEPILKAEPPITDVPRLTQEQAVAIGEKAIMAKMEPEYINKYKPYRANFRVGVWHVYGTLPGGGPGGTPEARVQDRDGKVLGVFHSQ